jgi:4-amino-4-deoxy-L-arabinose transferase-like glycosyltransferase
MHSAYKYLGHPIALLFVYLLTAGIIIYTIDYYPKGSIEIWLIKAVPWALLTNMVLILIGIILCRQEIAGFFSKLFGPALKKINYQGVLLVLIIIFSFVMASFVAPRTHRIYFDEDIYANVGQNIALSNQAAICNYGEFVHGEYKPNWLSYNKEPNGWPYLISLAFQIFGANELYVFLLNNLILAAGVGLVFIITSEITGAFFPSIMAAFIFSLIPHNLIWANTAAAEPAAAFFTLASLLCLIIYLKTNQWRHLYLLAAILPFSSQMRLESILIIPLSFLALILVRPENILRRQLWGAGIITAIFLAPLMLHLYAESGQSWGAEGAMFSLDFFRNNIMVNGLYYLNNEAFPALVTIFAVLGLFFAKYSGKWKIIIFVWFLAFWGIFLFFYAGSYRYGADVRFAVVSFAPLTILAALGMDWIKNKLQPLCSGTNATIIIVLILLVAWIKFLPLIRLVGQEAWAARRDHALTREFIKKIPDRSVVISHIPTMLLLWGQDAVSVHGSLNDEGFMRHLISKFDGGVYFHHNYWCDTSSDANTKVCREVRKKYDLEEIVSDSSTGRLFGLYRIRIKEVGNK